MSFNFPAKFFVVDSLTNSIKEVVLYSQLQYDSYSITPIFSPNNIIPYNIGGYVIQNAHIVSFLKNNRDYQTEALASMSGKHLGYVILPCGTGKTRIQISSHLVAIDSLNSKNETGVFVIGCHRLMLCHQLLDSFMKELERANISYDILFVNSDNIDNSDFASMYPNFQNDIGEHRVKSTTNGIEISKAHAKAKENKRHLIVVATYHSFDKLSRLGHINNITYDEAHTLVNDKENGNVFLNNIKGVANSINIDSQYFFTATLKCGKNHAKNEGMNNSYIFGKCLYSKLPVEMIERGEILQPKLHIMSTEKEVVNNETMLIKSIIQGFDKHKENIYHESLGRLGAKMIVGASGQPDIDIILKSNILKEYCTKNNIKMFCVTSETSSVDFEICSRKRVYKQMEKIKDDDKCEAILLHINILTEGIDLPNVTGVMLMREMSLSKLVQMVGRACRLYNGDRLNIYNGVITPNNIEQYTKKYAHVIIPEYFQKLTNPEALKELIRDIFTTYNPIVEGFDIKDMYSGSDEEDGKDITTKAPKEITNNDEEISHIFECLCDESMEERIQNMTLQELLYFA